MPPEKLQGQVESQTSDHSAAGVHLEPPRPDSASPAVIPPPAIETISTPEPPQAAAPQAKPPVSDDENNLVELRTSDFKRIKDKAAAKGRRSERLLLNERAKELGFESAEAAFKALAEPIQPESVKPEEENMAPPRKPKKPTERQSIAADSRYKRRYEQSEKARKDTMRKWRASEKRRRDAQRQLAAKEAEMELREVAIQAGIKDVDYSIRLLTRHLHNKSESDLAAFDEQEFFTGLRADQPYLFGESVVPATTGVANADDGAAAPEPGETNQIEAKDKQFDARTASADEVRGRLKELGMSQPLV